MRPPLRHFEDFRPGDVIELGSRTITKEAIIAFAKEFDPQVFHVDEEAAKQTIYGGLLASGWHTGSLLMRLLYDGLVARTASLGSPGIDELRWLKPVWCLRSRGSACWAAGRPEREAVPQDGR
ncbi:MAG: acyl dehydratase [Candidatus Rokubacteria bacterium]|nr:acyl dehydratase [Candidatus Rokubacteria bacterium]